jgi:hypothetical protein
MCWRDEVKRHHSDMTLDQFKTAIRNRAERGTRIFQLSFFGESTLYHHLIEALAFIKTSFPDAVVVLNTNGAYLTEALSTALIEGGLDQLRISIDGADAAAYERIRVGLKYHVVQENVHRIWDYIQRTGARTQLMIQGLNLASAPLTLAEYRATWGAFAHQIAVRDEHDLIALKPEPLFHKLAPCPKMFSQEVIMVDGGMALCAYDWHGNVVLGNVWNQPVSTLKQSLQKLVYRLGHLMGMKRLLPVCKSCTYQVFG